MMTATNLSQAIERSISHCEIATVTLTGDITTIMVDVAQYADHVDYTANNDGTFDVWGWSNEMEQTGSSETLWRLCMTVTNEAYETGYEAARQGEDKIDNPHSRGTWEHTEWARGWRAAQ